ncbi:carbonic anhydrase [Paenibacillus silviterrae]|uniref:carbonic anhydrase n=1 Tax=Paenibacillus silviterrae TaxID=3242194 RepID=UPI002543A705|nr:carbonic anhydrase family protein [Paenibacillus chinjuensis]
MKRKYCTLITVTSLSLLFFASQSAAAIAPVSPRAEAPPATRWSYEGVTGPAHWGKLDPAFAVCANGKEQSPISIDPQKVTKLKNKESIQYHYQRTLFTVMNNGHTVQANDPSGSNSIVLEGQPYKLLQMHFHKPSEHEINRKPYMMEGHLVHQNAEGKLAVVGFLIEAGKTNEELAEMWNKLPKQQTESDIKLEREIDLSRLLPEDRTSYLYNGSLTTPPCTEGVRWILLKQPIQMSKEQIEAFGAIFPDNHRPVQPLNQRKVIENEANRK